MTASAQQGGPVRLFDGHSLAGWRAIPRLPVPERPGAPEPDPATDTYRAAARTSGCWTVQDGAIVGGQEAGHRGFGGYLITEDEYDDFELTLDVKPDWPADTGVLLRSTNRGAQGYQVLIDHRRSGGIGGFYGNGLAGFHALAYNVDVARDAAERPTALVIEDPGRSLEPVTAAKRDLLSYAAPPEAFLAAWRWSDWNELRVRCVGAQPVLTTWVNGVCLYELDTATITWPGWDGARVTDLLGRSGHISLEVHDNDIEGMGDERWGPGAVVRWRNLTVRSLRTDRPGDRSGAVDRIEPDTDPSGPPAA